MDFELQKIIRLLKKCEIRIAVNNDDLELYNSKGIYPDGILKKVKRNKVELIAYLNLIRSVGKTENSLKENSEKYEENKLSETLKLQERRYIKYKLRRHAPSNLVVLREKLKNVNRAALTRAITALVIRHESLRTLFAFIDGKVVQKIYPKNKFKNNLLFEDISLLKNKKEKLGKIIDDFSNYLFDFENEQSFKCKLIKYDKNEHEFIFVIDHIISDLRSIKILREEVIILYDVYNKNGLSPLKSLKFQLSDYVTYCNQHYKGYYLNYHISYYKDLLCNTPLGLVIKSKYSGYGEGSFDEFFSTSDLSEAVGISKTLSIYGYSVEDYRVLTKSSKGGAYTFTISEEILKYVSVLASELKTSLYNVFLAIFGIFLCELGDENEIIIDTPISCRDNEDFSKIVGWLTGALVLKVEVESDLFLRDVILSLKNKIIEAMKHSYYQPEIQLVASIQAQLNFMYENDTEYIGRDLPSHNDTNVFFDFLFQITVYKNRIFVCCQYDYKVIHKSKIIGLCQKFSEMLEMASRSKNGNVRVLELITHSIDS